MRSGDSRFGRCRAQPAFGAAEVIRLFAAHVSGGNLTSCDVAVIPSRNSDPQRDGPGSPGNQLCVESQSSAASPPWNYTNHWFVDNTSVQGVPNGTNPTTPAQFCKH